MPVKEPQTVEIAGILEFSERFDEIIDVRSPSEFALDHLPGAVNYPVLTDDERKRVGTINAEQSAFEANKLGAALVSKNISEHLSGSLADNPRQWRPLVYCWRGGNRSGSLATVLARIGYKTSVLTGGYRAYRRWVVEALPGLVDTKQLRIIAGRTGSGKSRILDALRESGAQVLDLERLANHRGSVLGLLPHTRQPSQKQFESRLMQALSAFESNRSIYVESESRKIGQVQVPDCLIARMRSSSCHVISMSPGCRAAFLLQDYSHFVRDPASLMTRLEHLRERYGHDQFNVWQQLVNTGQWPAFVENLLTTHYDPAYDQSMARNYQQLGQANHVTIRCENEPTDIDFKQAANAILTFEHGR